MHCANWRRNTTAARRQRWSLARKLLSDSILNVSTNYLRHESHPARGYLFIAAATFCWGLSAALGRAMFTGRFSGGAQALRPIDPLILAQSRSTFALLILAPLLLATNRSALRV